MASAIPQQPLQTKCPHEDVLSLLQNTIPLSGSRGRGVVFWLPTAESAFSLLNVAMCGRDEVKAGQEDKYLKVSYFLSSVCGSGL